MRMNILFFIFGRMVPLGAMKLFPQQLDLYSLTQAMLKPSGGSE